MKFEQFKTNVEQWQAERGIYEHSTALAQALKGVSEAGELADAVIKGDRDALADAIGDVMVCLVGVAKMTGCDIGLIEKSSSWTRAVTGIQKAAAFAAAYVADVGFAVAVGREGGRVADSILDSAYWLNDIAVKSDITLLECCESAWLEIKDRKGKMVAGGAFVKDGES